MVTQQVVLTTTVVATDTLTQQRLVSVTGGLCKSGDVPLGVAEVSGKAGDAVPVNVLGIIAVEVGGVIDAGAALAVDDQGRVVATGGKVRAKRATGNEQPTPEPKKDGDGNGTDNPADPKPAEPGTDEPAPAASTVGIALDAASGEGQFIRVLWRA